MKRKKFVLSKKTLIIKRNYVLTVRKEKYTEELIKISHTRTLPNKVNLIEMKKISI